MHGKQSSCIKSVEFWPDEEGMKHYLLYKSSWILNEEKGMFSFWSKKEMKALKGMRWISDGWGQMLLIMVSGRLSSLKYFRRAIQILVLYPSLQILRKEKVKGIIRVILQEGESLHAKLNPYKYS